VWVPAFQLGETEFRILLRTFLSVFGRAQVWRGDFSPTRPALGLVASERALEAAEMERRLSQMETDPSNSHLGSARAFWMHFVGIVDHEEETRINSENRPWIELLAPRQKSSRFIGRSLLTWQAHIGKRASVTGDAERGRLAGELMMEFTLAVSERQEREAREVRGKLRGVLDEEAFRLVFEGQ
jgi:hypothetical protein